MLGSEEYRCGSVPTNVNLFPRSEIPLLENHDLYFLQFSSFPLLHLYLPVVGLDGEREGKEEKIKRKEYADE